jgi:hypothetical protein
MMMTSLLCGAKAKNVSSSLPVPPSFSTPKKKGKRRDFEKTLGGHFLPKNSSKCLFWRQKTNKAFLSF